MSSAIEVLKDIKESIEDSWKCRNKDYNTAIININISQVKYIDEALLALEKQEREKNDKRPCCPEMNHRTIEEFGYCSECNHIYNKDLLIFKMSKAVLDLSKLKMLEGETK